MSGSGELTRAGGGAPLLPLAVAARPGSKSTEAIYETASGVKPVVRAELKNRDPNTGVVEFSIKVDRATIPVGPALCAGSQSAPAPLRTAFSLQVGAGAPVILNVTLPWRCWGLS